MVGLQQCCNGCWNSSMGVVMNGVTNIEGCKHGKVNKKVVHSKSNLKMNQILI
jgi:hypothetical protein